MKEKSENRIEKRIITGYDFAASLKVNELLKEVGEDPYRSELRTDIAETISNLSRNISTLLIREAIEEEIVTELDAALLGERESSTPIRLSEEKRQKIRDVILKKLQQIRAG